jgi:uncharacterized membrane protein
LPALSSAVIDSLSPRLQQLEEVQIAIAPGQRAPRGAATLAAVFGYCGTSFPWLSGGEWRDAWGWQDMKRLRFAGLGNRLAAACDVPDLELFPSRYRGLRTVEFRAALELAVQQFALWLAAGLRRFGAPLPLERWTALLDRLASTMNVFAGQLGGMLVSLTGTRPDGTRARVEWHLTVNATDGPEIPCMAAILLARRLASGELVGRGAFPCMGFLTLEDFEPEFARWKIATTITGFGIAFFTWFGYRGAMRSGDIGHLRGTLRLTVIADAWLTAPAVGFQALSGVALMHMLGWPMASPWSIAVWGLFALAGACWVPVLVIQARLSRIAEDTTSLAALPREFHRWFSWWLRLGSPAFAAVIAIYWLMVAKPLGVS